MADSGVLDAGVDLVALEDFVVRFSEGVCAHEIRCGKLAPDEAQTCASTRARWWRGAVAGVSHGSARFDPGLVASCLGAFSSLSCDEPQPACAGVIRPGASPGEPCFGPLDCRGASAHCAGAACARTCRLEGERGAPCRSDDCDPGLWCDHAADPRGLCRDKLPAGAPCDPMQQACAGFCDPAGNTCRALPVAGQPCAGFACDPDSRCDFTVTPRVCRALAGIGEACATGPCVRAAFCDFSAASPTCVARRAEGGACRAPMDCQDGLICIGATCAQRRGEGEACAGDFECNPAFVCDAIARTCQFQEMVGSGAPCSENRTSCATTRERCIGAVVNPDGGVGTFGRCAVPRPGDACYADFQCSPGDRCDLDGGTTGTCAAGMIGAACTPGTRCAPGTFCPFGRTSCVPLRMLGETCMGGLECAAPFDCLPAADAGQSTCALRPGRGAPCSSPGSCLAPNACFGGVCVSAGHIGEPCVSGPMCLTGVVTVMVDGMGLPLGCRCEPWRAEGQPCLNFTDCASLNCIDGRCVAACP